MPNDSLPLTPASQCLPLPLPFRSCPCPSLLVCPFGAQAFPSSLLLSPPCPLPIGSYNTINVCRSVNIDPCPCSPCPSSLLSPHHHIQKMPSTFNSAELFQSFHILLLFSSQQPLPSLHTELLATIALKKFFRLRKVFPVVQPLPKCFPDTQLIFCYPFLNVLSVFIPLILNCCLAVRFCRTPLIILLNIITLYIINIYYLFTFKKC